MSDRGIPASYHTCTDSAATSTFINANNERWVKFHLPDATGYYQNLTDAEAEPSSPRIGGHQRDLYEHIERVISPLDFVQIMPEADAEKLPYHPF